jgi:hypothetical protein
MNLLPSNLALRRTRPAMAQNATFRLRKQEPRSVTARPPTREVGKKAPAQFASTSLSSPRS